MIIPPLVLTRRLSRRLQVEGLTPPPSKTAYPELCGDKSFYSVLRLKVAAYLKAAGGPGPSAECLRLWWVVLTCWCLGFATVVATGSFLAAVVNGIIGAWLGGFGCVRHSRNSCVLTVWLCNPCAPPGADPTVAFWPPEGITLCTSPHIACTATRWTCWVSRVKGGSGSTICR